VHQLRTLFLKVQSFLLSGFNDINCDGPNVKIGHDIQKSEIKADNSESASSILMDNRVFGQSQSGFVHYQSIVADCKGHGMLLRNPLLSSSRIHSPARQRGFECSSYVLLQLSG
jgi:hypothetical protein